MSVCANCGEVLERAWKYCIHCGAPLGADAAIPGAIRPDDEPATGRSRPDLPLVIGIALAAIGLGVIISLAVLFLLPRAV
jgi:hypothetical protein